MSLEDVVALVVDDNANMRSLMRAILVSFGVRRMEEASDCETALGSVAVNPIDIAFVDFRLEAGDGLEFCRRIRRDPASPNRFLPLVMITAYAEQNRVIEALNAGVDEFLVKPVRPVDVANRINAVVERRRPFVESATYFGPDRRRRVDPRYTGPLRRATDPGTLDIF